MTREDELRASVAALKGGNASSSGTPSTASMDDDITPFPSPMLSAQSLAGLSREPIPLNT